MQNAKLNKIKLTRERGFGILSFDPNITGGVAEGVAVLVSKVVIINNQVGLHARPATFFIQKANEFKSSIWIEKDDRRVNAKSLLGVLSLGIVKGTNVTIVADGADEDEAILTLSELIDSDFSE